MAAPTMEQHVILQERMMSGWLWAELRASRGQGGACQSQALCGDLAFLPVGKNLPKKFVAFPPMSTSLLCKKCL